MKSSSTLNFLQCSILTSCIVEKIMLDRTQKVPRPMGLWVCQPVHDSTRRGTTKVAKCKYEGMDLCVSAKICVHHKVVLTFHDKCVKCVCPTAALVAESRAFILVKSRTTFKHAHTLMIWCKTETWKCQQEFVLGKVNPFLSIWLHSNNVLPTCTCPTTQSSTASVYCTCNKMLHKPGRFTKLWANGDANTSIVFSWYRCTFDFFEVPWIVQKPVTLPARPSQYLCMKLFTTEQDLSLLHPVR